MKEIILTFLIIFITLGLIYTVRRLSSIHKPDLSRPRAYITVFYDNDPCFEMKFQKLASSRIFSDFEVSIRVVDLVSTNDSTKWLKSLSKKTDICFDIINKK
ncbi:MAG: hypothetical protein IJ424_04695 [Oscillospiraceae bacterium]|nr:hypothetical protein [Oscillospiraceae bacterium]